MQEASRSYDVALSSGTRWTLPRAPRAWTCRACWSRRRTAARSGRADEHGTLRLLERALDELGDDAPPLRRAGMMTKLGRARWRATANLARDLEMQEQALALLDGEPSQVAALVESQYASALMMLGDSIAPRRPRPRRSRSRARSARAPRRADALVTQFVCAGVARRRGGHATRWSTRRARRPSRRIDGNVVRRFFTNAGVRAAWVREVRGGAGDRARGHRGRAQGGHQPARADVHLRERGRALCILGRPREAAELLGDEVGAYSSDTAVMHTTRSRIALQLGDPSEPRAEATKASPRRTSPVLLLGRVAAARRGRALERRRRPRRWTRLPVARPCLSRTI